MLLRVASILLLLACVPAPCVLAQTEAEPRVRVAMLDFGQAETGVRAAQVLAGALAAGGFVTLVDRDLSRDAARGAGYAGSLNLTLREARDLGAAIDCDFYITGDAQTLRRSPSAGAAYFESYASVFVVSAHTGRLVMWARPSREAPTPEAAEKALLEEVGRLAFACRVGMLRWQEDERSRLRARETGRGGATVIEDAPEEGSPAAEGFREPAPYRRLRPTYTDEAARAGAEATVDVSVEVGADGEVGRVEVVRWAGFGLDEAVVSTVRQMHFRPATRDGQPFPVRILLRYNFRAPKKTN